MFDNHAKGDHGHKVKGGAGVGYNDKGPKIGKRKDLDSDQPSPNEAGEGGLGKPKKVGEAAQPGKSNRRKPKDPKDYFKSDGKPLKPEGYPSKRVSFADKVQDHMAAGSEFQQKM